MANPKLNGATITLDDKIMLFMVRNERQPNITEFEEIMSEHIHTPGEKKILASINSGRKT